MRVEEIAFTNRDEWLAARIDDFTASDVGALFGGHKYRTLRGIAAEKASRKVAKIDSAVLRRGIIAEPAIVRALELDHGLDCVAHEHYLRARSGDPFFRLGATKDYQMFASAEALHRVLGDRFPRAWRRHFGGEPMSIAVELKSVDYGVHEREWADGVPYHHLAQAATQAWLGDDDGALVVELVIGFSWDLHVYPVERSAAFEAEVARRVSAFWERFDAGESQPADVSDPARLLYPQANAKVTANLKGSAEEAPKINAARVAAVTASRVVVDLAEHHSVDTWDHRLAEREAAKAAEKAAKGFADEIDEQLKRDLGEAEEGDLPGWKVSWKNRSDGPRVLAVKREKKR